MPPPRESALAPRGSTPGSRTSTPPARDGFVRPDGLDLARKLRGDEAVVHDAEPGSFLFGSWKNVFVAVWESQATMSSVDRMVRASSLLGNVYPGGRSNIHIIADGAGLPSPEVRAHFVELMKEHSLQLSCVAVVVGGTGFWTSALRSFVTGLRWLAPRNFDFRLFGTIQEVARWLPAEHQKRSGVSVDSRRLVQVLESWAGPRKPGLP